MKKFKIDNNFLSIRTRILIFSILAALAPSIGMGWLINSMMYATIADKTEQKLLDSFSIIDREISLWFKERSYDLRVFSNSFVIAESFNKYLGGVAPDHSEDGEEPIHIKNIVTYLSSVRNQFPNYSRMVILNKQGDMVASSETGETSRSIRLPVDALSQIDSTGYFKGEVFFEGPNNDPLMLIGVPIFSDKQEENMWLLAGEVHLRDILNILQANLFSLKTALPICGSIVRLGDGRHLLSRCNIKGYVAPVTIPENIIKLFSFSPRLQEYTDPHDVRMVGIAAPLTQNNWGLIIAERYDDVYADLTSSRNRNIYITISFALIISLAAYFLTVMIITPLTTLTNGALKVAEGDLDVELPIYKNDELGIATRVFNEMVAELKQSHQKLQAQATTDFLTNLANRKRIMNILLNQFLHHQRYATPFSILMIDVDHFKTVNDTYSHLAGDEVLKQLADVLRKTLRNVDYPGRYGGEEFLVILSETNGEEAQNSSERIRRAVKEHTFTFQNHSLKLSVSIGVTTVQQTDKNEYDIVKRADDGLYEAKAGGRDRVVYVNGSPPVSKKVVSLQRSIKE